MPLREDINQLKYSSIWQLSPLMPNYYRTLFKYSMALFNSMGRSDLTKELQEKIDTIAIRMGTTISFVYWVYENMPALNSFTKSKNPRYEDGYIYKYTIAQWFQDIEDWVYESLIEIEPKIRFTQLKPIN